jgi:hypothetical protein
MLSLLVFNIVFRQAGDTVSHVFDPALCTSAPLTFSMVHLPPYPPFPKSMYSTKYTDSVWLGGDEEGGVELFWRPYSAGI